MHTKTTVNAARRRVRRFNAWSGLDVVKLWTYNSDGTRIVRRAGVRVAPHQP